MSFKSYALKYLPTFSSCTYMLTYLNHTTKHCQHNFAFIQRIFMPPCAAKAFCYCPSMISHRPRSQNILTERALNPEKDSRIKRPRSHVSLEKSSQNYKELVAGLLRPRLFPFGKLSKLKSAAHPFSGPVTEI
jgi:hypothetical protein